MTSLTGNTTQPNNHPTERVNGAPYSGVPDLVYPNLRWGGDDYAALQGRLDLFSDFIVLSKYRDGQATERYVVDPLELAAAVTDLDLNSGLLPRDCLFWGKRHGADRMGVYLPPRSGRWSCAARSKPGACPCPV